MQSSPLLRRKTNDAYSISIASDYFTSRYDCELLKMNNVYTSFEQWKNSNWLETDSVPRSMMYSERDLQLIEMGWKYGYDAGVLVREEKIND